MSNSLRGRFAGLPRSTPAAKGATRWSSFLGLLTLVVALVLSSLPRITAWPSGFPGGIQPQIAAQFGDFITDFVVISATDIIITGKNGRVVLFRNGNAVSTLLDISWKVQPAAGGM